MTAIAVNSQFMNLKTGETVEVTKIAGDRAEVVTVTTTGARINPRSLPIASLKSTPYNSRGDYLLTGLVAVEALPEGHPLKPESFTTATLTSAVASPDGMGDEELYAYALSCKARMELAKSVYETARMELASRTPEEGGVRVQGKIAVEATPNRRISESLAREVLTAEQFALVSVPKVESSLVKKILGDDMYSQVCKDHGWTIKVREATNKDYETVRAQGGAEEEDFEFKSVPLE